MSRFSLSIASLAALAVFVAATAPAVHAGEYRVYSCKMPNGMPAPTDGWLPGKGGSAQSDPVNHCATGGALVAELNRSAAQPANSGIVTWGWNAPAGTSIVSYRVWRSGALTDIGDAGASPFLFSTRPRNEYTGAYVVDNCAAYAACAGFGGATPALSHQNLVAEDVRSLGPVNAWYINAACGGITGQYCMPRASVMASVAVHAAEFTLRDPDAPTTASVTGRLTSAGPHAGTEIISFGATDAVSGVYRSFLEVDGKVVRTAVVDSNDGRCADAGVDPASPYEFLYREPCRKSVQHDLSLDTRTVTDGTHSIRVLVEDASGNRTSVFSNPEFVVKNGADGAAATGGVQGAGQAGGGGGGGGAAPCDPKIGGLSARFSRTDSTRITVRHGSAFTVKGRAPSNGDLDVFHVRGSRVTPLGSVRATQAGTFTERFRARHGNGTIHLCGPGVATSLALRVKAKVSLKVRISKGGLVRYSGRVSTGQIPKGGKIVAIQGKAGPNWQTFGLRRTDKRGRFKGRYRLRVVIPGARLKFRVRVPSEAGYPFVGVVSRAQTKRVR